MSFLILHLSDLHIHDINKLPNTTLIASCLRDWIDPYEAIFVAVSGDIAYSGKTEEFEVADNYFRELCQQIYNVTNKKPKPDFDILAVAKISKSEKNKSEAGG